MNCFLDLSLNEINPYSRVILEFQNPFKAANFQRHLRKILGLISFMLFVVLITIFFCLDCPLLYIMKLHE